MRSFVTLRLLAHHFLFGPAFSPLPHVADAETCVSTPRLNGASHRVIGRLPRAVVLLMPICLALSACSSPPSRFYTLSGDTARTSTGPNSTALGTTQAPTASYAIEVTPVAIPEQVNRPQFVTGRAPGQVNILETSRWAAPLNNELTSALSEALTQRLGAMDIWGLPHADTLPVYRVSTVVQRFESLPGEQATLSAVWAVRRVPGDVLLTCRFEGAQTGTDGIDALVAAHRVLVGRLATAISSAIAVARQGQTPRCE